MLPNPHYSPETCSKCVLLNFSATSEGLLDQMLGLTVSTERPDLEEQREKLIVEDAANKATLKQLEDKILGLVSGKGENNASLMIIQALFERLIRGLNHPFTFSHSFLTSFNVAAGLLHGQHP